MTNHSHPPGTLSAFGSQDLMINGLIPPALFYPTIFDDGRLNIKLLYVFNYCTPVTCIYTAVCFMTPPYMYDPS